MALRETALVRPGSGRWMRYLTATGITEETSKKVRELLVELGINWADIEFDAVEHHVAHASSSYHLSGFEGKTAISGHRR